MLLRTQRCNISADSMTAAVKIGIIFDFAL